MGSCLSCEDSDSRYGREVGIRPNTLNTRAVTNDYSRQCIVHDFQNSYQARPTWTGYERPTPVFIGATISTQNVIIQSRAAQNNVVRRNQVREIRTAPKTRVNKAVSVNKISDTDSALVPWRPRQGDSSQALYGEYNCHKCGRWWHSTLSWANSYQCCKHCKTNVYPKSQREVKPSDFTKEDELPKEHSRDLCQKCKDLGYYCGNYNSNKKMGHKTRRSRNI